MSMSLDAAEAFLLSIGAPVTPFSIEQIERLRAHDRAHTLREVRDALVRFYHEESDLKMEPESWFEKDGPFEINTT